MRARLFGLALVAPLLVFLAVFFIWPLATMIQGAVLDPVVAQALPNTARATALWDRQSAPSQGMKAAFASDIAALNDDQIVGDITRRLNSAQPGFRTLMSRTVAAIRDQGGDTDLTAVDRRWNETDYWRAIADAVASRYTDRYLLAAIDFNRDPLGTIEVLPADQSANRAILGRTFAIAAIVTIACIAIGLPYAMLAASLTGWLRGIMLGAVLLPLWTSLLVRTAAWFILLQDNGLINTMLITLHLTDSPLPMIFNRLGVIIAMTHVLLPFMVLPIFSVLVGIPRNLMPAAASLGANPFMAFFRVLLPLSMRGVVSGSLLVFMAAIGYYITPALLGGPKDQMISSVIAFYAMGAANWGMAGALGIVLLVATLILYAVYQRLSTDQTAGAV
jgi:putative spermidine/putrescine transport system permease protein